LAHEHKAVDVFVMRALVRHDLSRRCRRLVAGDQAPTSQHSEGQRRQRL